MRVHWREPRRFARVAIIHESAKKPARIAATEMFDQFADLHARRVGQRLRSAPMRHRIFADMAEIHSRSTRITAFRLKLG